MDVGFSVNLNVNIGFSRDFLMDVGFSVNLNVNIGLSRDFLMDVGFIANLNVNIGLSRNLLMDVRLSRRVQVGISNAGIVESSIDSSIRSSSIGHRLVSVGNWSCSSNNMCSSSYGSSSSVTIGVRVTITSNQRVGG